MTAVSPPANGWKNSKFVALYQHLGRVFSRIDNDSGARSLLRRRVCELDSVDAYPVIYPGIPSELTGNGYPTSWELAIRDTACLYARAAKSGWTPHQPTQSGEGYAAGSIGYALQKVSWARGRGPQEDNVTVDCLNKLVTATSREELVRALERAVTLISDHRVRTDYLRLSADLYRLYQGADLTDDQHSVRHKWSVEYLTRMDDKTTDTGDLTTE